MSMNRNHYRIFSEGSIAGLTIPNRLIRSATWADANRFEKLFLDTLNGRLP
jgi:hypothetical protein